MVNFPSPLQRQRSATDASYFNEGIEIDDLSVLPLHTRDALNIHNDPAVAAADDEVPSSRRYRSSSSNCSESQQQVEGEEKKDADVPVMSGKKLPSLPGGGCDEEEPSASHNYPSPDESTLMTDPGEERPNPPSEAATVDFHFDRDYLMTQKQMQQLQQPTHEDDDDTEVPCYIRRKRVAILLFCIALLLIAGAILAAVLLTRPSADEPQREKEGNTLVLDPDNPNDLSPSPGIDGNTDDDDSEFPYLPPDDGSSVVDTANYCPINFIPRPIRDFNRTIQLYGSTNNINATLFPPGTINNPNVVEGRTLPLCDDGGKVEQYGYGVWYHFIGPGAAVSASTCQLMGIMWGDSSSGTSDILDTQLSVFTSQTDRCSDRLQCVTSDDDSCMFQSVVHWFAEAGRPYFLFVHGKPRPKEEVNQDEIVIQDGFGPAIIGDFFYPTGDFSLNIELAPMGTCEAAIQYDRVAVEATVPIYDISREVNVASSLVQGSLLGPSFTMDPCSAQEGVDWMGRGGEIWYQVKGYGGWMMASTCQSGRKYNEFPPKLALYKGPCTELQCGLSLASDTAPSIDRDCGFGHSLNWWSEPDEWYYIMVYKTNFLPGINFGLSVDRFMPPVNDNCTDAILVAADGSVTYGSTLRATYTQEMVAPTCTVPHSHPGVWFQVVGTGTRLTASLCDEGTNYDTKISVFTGDGCGSLQCVGGNDQWCGFQSAFDWEATTGQMYWILVHGSTGGVAASIGDFGLSVYEVKPTDNDVCDDAIGPLKPGSITYGSTQTASADDYILDTCDGVRSNQAPGVWYTVQGTGGGLHASTCGSETNFDTRITIYRGTDCGRLQCLVTNDNGCGFQSSVYWHSNSDETYYILVHGNLFSTFGDFVLRINNYRPNTLNDFCVSALWASVQGSDVDYDIPTIGSTKNATFDGVDTCIVPNTSPGTWYKVEGSGTGMRASTCHQVTDFDTRISVFRGGCDNLECVAGNDDGPSCTSAGSTVSWLSTPGEVYHLLVHGWGSLTGTFALTARQVVPQVPNDFCVKAVEIPVNFMNSTANVGSTTTRGSTVNATIDNVPICGDVQRIGYGVWYMSYGTGNRLVASTCNDFGDADDDITFLAAASTAATNFDTQISVFRGGCRSLECVGANNDRCGRQSSVTFQVEKDEPFYILVHGAWGEVGKFELAVDEYLPQIENDYCDTATTLDANSEVSGSTTEATYNTVAECVVPNTSPAVWYEIVGTGRPITATTCGEATTFDTRLSVFTGSCNMLECLTGNDDDSGETVGCGLASTVTWPSIEGESVFLLVHGWGATVGDFVLRITEEVVGA